ncbi:MAG TPA: DNA-protecting protein DprA [Leucothrix mucor]|uniref:DNA-protecting protein DprA n=2 Tax=Leucothrix mucor TaxID=45248 RepID=A0A7V2WUL7_LEUMU|nr:DNA-protecting protein DprA [Leucothrix mucor]
MNHEKNQAAWIALWRVSGVGCVHYKTLLDAFQTPENVFNANAEQLKKAGISLKLIKNINAQTLSSADPDMQWLQASDQHHLVTFEDPRYPQRLKEIPASPPLLYVHGDADLLNDPQLAIVGSRNPTQGGQNNTYEFSKHLAATGLCITSGLALGVDGIAHKGALEADGVTIAVIATGIDRVYPARHRDLAHRIVAKGAIITELPIGVSPLARNFPRRNRIISGISLGTLVVEAALKSGSLISARYASEQGREVFAIPGSIHNPLARGCHQLIRQGAKLIETAEHILEELAPQLEQCLLTTTKADSSNAHAHAKNNSHTSSSPLADADQRLVLETMGYDPIPIDQLVIQTGLTAEALSSILLLLELNGFIAASGRGNYTRIKEA